MQDLSKVIKDRIKNYDNIIRETETGYVVEVGDGIARIHGLDACMAGELIELDGGVMSMALNLEEDNVSVVILGDDTGIKEGSIAKRTGRVADVPVGDALLGRVVDALGNPIDGKGAINTTETRPVESPASGKTAIAVDTIINQKDTDVLCIYVAIGQKRSTVASIVDTLEKAGAMDYTIVVSATASEMPALQYIAPYAGCAMGEYFMYKGKDVLIVYDDLSKHAVAYRALSLLLRRSPGREAYPGDVFYLHSRLLERAARLSEDLGGGSLTALPIIETQAGDVSAYIPTNVISITDGQIFLETELFHSGIMPAVNPGISVSRVGGNAQIKAMKKVAGSLKLSYSQYRELQAFAQFGSDLDKDTKMRLAKGERIVEVLKQGRNTPIRVSLQVVIIYAVINDLLEDIPVERIQEFETSLFEYIENNAHDIIDTIENTGEMNKECEEKIRSSVEDCKKRFVK